MRALGPISLVPTSPPNPQQPLCCTYVLCGRVQTGPIDGILTTCQLLTSISSIALGASGEYVSCALLGISSLSCFIAHGLYRKYGNLVAASNQFSESEKKEEASLNANTAEGNRLETTLATTSKNILIEERAIDT